MAAEENIDWSECPLVEVNPRVQSGGPCAAWYADAGQRDYR
jgi:hypothetical protein